MPDIELPNILTISCSTIGTEKEDKDINFTTNRPNTYNTGSEYCCAYTGPERSCRKKTATQTAVQTQAIIQIQIILMHSYQQSTIMMNIFFLSLAKNTTGQQVPKSQK